MHYTATYSPEDNKLRLYESGRLPADIYQRVKSAGSRYLVWVTRALPSQNPIVSPYQECVP